MIEFKPAVRAPKTNTIVIDQLRCSYQKWLKKIKKVVLEQKRTKTSSLQCFSRQFEYVGSITLQLMQRTGMASNGVVRAPKTNTIVIDQLRSVLNGKADLNIAKPRLG